MDGVFREIYKCIEIRCNGAVFYGAVCVFLGKKNVKIYNISSTYTSISASTSGDVDFSRVTTSEANKCLGLVSTADQFSQVNNSSAGRARE